MLGCWPGRDSRRRSAWLVVERERLLQTGGRIKYQIDIADQTAGVDRAGTLQLAWRGRQRPGGQRSAVGAKGDRPRGAGAEADIGGARDRNGPTVGDAERPAARVARRRGAAVGRRQPAPLTVARPVEPDEAPMLLPLLLAVPPLVTLSVPPPEPPTTRLPPLVHVEPTPLTVAKLVEPDEPAMLPLLLLTVPPPLTLSVPLPEHSDVDRAVGPGGLRATYGPALLVEPEL